MDRKNETFHYHIRWQGGGSTLDWEMWSTRAGAEYSARQIVQPGETYVIEELGETCMTCAAIRVKAARGGK
jgi:hypothetical protein